MDIALDMHTHTIVSGHAYSTIREMMRAASEKSLKLLGITEHGPTIPGACHPIYFCNLRVVPRQMYGVELMLGAEVNITDYRGKLDLPDDTIDKLDVRIAGLHAPCIQPGTLEQCTAAVAAAMKNPRIDIISHPDDGQFPLDYAYLVQLSKEQRTLLEVNNNSLNPVVPRRNTRSNCLKMLALCKKYQTPVIIGSDAHVDADVARCDFAMDVLREADFPEALVVNRSAEAFKAFLAENRARERRILRTAQSA